MVGGILYEIIYIEDMIPNVRVDFVTLHIMIWTLDSVLSNYWDDLAGILND